MKITHNPDTLKKKSIFIFLYSLPVLVHVYNFYDVKTYQRYNFVFCSFFFFQYTLEQKIFPCCFRIFTYCSHAIALSPSSWDHAVGRIQALGGQNKWLLGGALASLLSHYVLMYQCWEVWQDFIHFNCCEMGHNMNIPQCTHIQGRI